jgi:hypothetical protein
MPRYERTVELALSAIVAVVAPLWWSYYHCEWHPYLNLSLRHDATIVLGVHVLLQSQHHWHRKSEISTETPVLRVPISLLVVAVAIAADAPRVVPVVDCATTTTTSYSKSYIRGGIGFTGLLPTCIYGISKNF